MIYEGLGIGGKSEMPIPNVISRFVNSYGMPIESADSGPDEIRGPA